MKRFSFALCSGIAAIVASAGLASAVITPGTYELANHPDGLIQPPGYGLRLYELYDATPAPDEFTFDFNHPSSNMFITYTGSTIRIFGTSFGGRDIGAAYAADAYQGVYTVDFLYNVGVSPVPGDDDIWVDAPTSSNFGTIIDPLGVTTRLLSDERGMFDYTFRLGNEDNDLGHGNHAGDSGWGWLRVDGNHAGNMDWIFTIVPAPGTTALLAGGALLAARRRR